jgi:hypothetical protein
LGLLFAHEVHISVPDVAKELPDERSDGPTVLPEEAGQVLHRADAQFLHPSGARLDASVGVHPDATLDANPEVHLAVHLDQDADVGKSAVHALEHAEVQAVPPDVPVPYKPDAVLSAERSAGAVVVHYALLVRAVLRSSDGYQASPLKLRVLSASRSQASQLSPRVRKASGPRASLFRRTPQALPPRLVFRVPARPASQLLREALAVSPPSTAESQPLPPVVRPTGV